MRDRGWERTKKERRGAQDGRVRALLCLGAVLCHILQRCSNRRIESLDERVSYWVDLADYDMGTARDMFKAGRYLYVG